MRLPEGWLVAGPGRRQDLGGGRFRFQPRARVPEVGLLAARFERRAVEAAGVEFELLLHPAHLRNLDYYDGAQEQIRSRLEEVFGSAAGFGIPYPYSGFTVVEVPAHLRGYGGGHWLDTQMVLPGMLLLKEHGFPFGDDIEHLLGDWLTDVALPGFMVSRARVERVADDADGKPRYAIRVHVRNDEPTPGLVRLSLGILPQSVRSEPVRVEGKTTVEVGMVTAAPPEMLWLEPYLARNRAPFRIDLEITDEREIAAREPFASRSPAEPMARW